MNKKKKKSNFLPEGYERPKSSGKYMRLEEGENKFRVLSPTIVGWEYWKREDDNPIPYRVKKEEDVPKKYINTSNWREKARFFWAFVVWNYEAQCVQILEITQKTIQNAIEDLSDNEKWGNPMDYDITITREEENRTKYSVLPDPKEEVSEEIVKALDASTIKLEALFENKDPFEVDDGEEIVADDVPF